MTPTQTIPPMLVSASLGKPDNLDEQESKRQASERAADHNATTRITGVDLTRGFLKSKQVLLKVFAAGVPQADAAMNSLFMDPATAITATPGGPRNGVLGYYAVGRVLQMGKEVQNIKNECLYVVADWTPRLMLVITNAQAHPPGPRQGRRARRTSHGKFIKLMVLMVVNIDVLVPVPEGVEPRLASLAADWLAMICHGVHSAAKVSIDAKDENAGKNTRNFNISNREPKVLVYGTDGPGMLAIQVAKHCGAEVYACDPKPHHRMLAMKAINRRGSVFAPEDVEEGGSLIQVDIVVDMVHDDESMRVGGALISWTQEIKHWAVLVY